MNIVTSPDTLEDRGGMPAAASALSVPAMPEPRMMARGGGSMITLRKSGARPVSFSGRQLGAHNGYRLGTALWHELNLYQTDDGRFVADIRVFTKAEGAKDQFHVFVADTLEDAIGYFESYDPRADVVADFDLDDPEMTPAELMVQAAALKYRVADAQSQYRALLGSFLSELNGA